MATATGAEPLRRNVQGRVIAGVCAGIAERLRVDPLVVRIAFVAMATAGGAGVLAYLLAWAVVPADDSRPAPAARLRTGRGALEVGVGTGLLVLSALLALRAAGLWFADVLVWPIVLVAAGGALIWRQSQAAGPAGPAAPRKPRDAARADTAARGPALPAALRGVSRTGLGVVLVVAAALFVLQGMGALGAARDVALAAVVVAVALGVIFAPWIVRLARSVTAERAERVRAQERAEVAAHLHDSVLQTLTLVQKRADDPSQVAALARRQERELRAWLSGRSAAPAASLVPALEAVASDVEDAHGVPVEVVAVGDRPLDAPAEALVAAAREAMTNAAKHSGAPVAVYVEAGDGGVTAFVRDRGAGFEPAAVPPDRRGVRESIVGRMARHGGRAEIHAAPGGGTEVELRLGR